MWYIKTGGANSDDLLRFYLPEEFLRLVMEGRKTQDIRPGDENRFADTGKKKYEFYSKDNSVVVDIVKAAHFKDLNSLLKAADKKALAPQLDEKDVSEYFGKFYDSEKIQRNGGLWLIDFKITKT